MVAFLLYYSEYRLSGQFFLRCHTAREEGVGYDLTGLSARGIRARAEVRQVIWRYAGLSRPTTCIT